MSRVDSVVPSPSPGKYLDMETGEERFSLGGILPGNDPEWDFMPQIRSLKPGVPSLVGLRRGALTIVGLSEWDGWWIVSCSCNRFGLRRAKFMRQPSKSEMDCCSKCRAYFRRAQEKRLANAA